MSGVKLHIKSNSVTCTSNNLLLICASKSLKITSVKQINRNFNVYIPSQDECEKFFESEALSALQIGGFYPVLPGALKAARTIIVHRAEEEILNHDETSIKQEIARCNDWAQVREVYKFKSLLKLVFNTTAMAEKCLHSGLSLFYLHIPSHKLIKDKFVTLNTCYSCYAIDNHTATNCPQKLNNRAYLICSKCANLGHSHLDCKASPEHFKCINCSGNHHSMAMACPRRKELLRKKRESPVNQTFSQAAKQPTNKPSPQEVDPTPIYKSVSLIFLAALQSSENPNSFSNNLNKLYDSNNLPTLNLDGFELNIPKILSLFNLQTPSDTHNQPIHPPPLSNPTAPEPMLPSTAKTSSLNKAHSSTKLPPLTADRTPPIATSSTSAPTLLENPPPSTLLPRSSSRRTSDTGSQRTSSRHYNNSPNLTTWNGMNVYKVPQKKVTSTDALLKLWDEGDIVIRRDDDTTPDRNLITAILSTSGLPRFIAKSKDNIRKLASKKC